MPKLKDLFIARLFAENLRQKVSGAKDGRPDWVAQISEGDDEGLFGEDSAVWQVHSSVATLIGGIRALLMQATHPAPLAGVTNHSRYQADPMGRLAGTTRWVTITTFASTQIVNKEAARVNQMHSKVSGEYKNKKNEIEQYSAQNMRFLLWVHCAFTDSFLTAHTALGYPITKGKDAYVGEWAKSAIPLGLSNPPRTFGELRDTLDDFRVNDLATTADTKGIVDFILNPQFKFTEKIFYKILLNAAIATLGDNELKILGLKKRSTIWLKISKASLEFLLLVLGSESPALTEAKARITRLKKRNLI